MNTFSHLSEKEKQPQMVNVSEKQIQKRIAIAEAVVILDENVIKLFDNGEFYSAKGAVIQTAIIAGVMAAKKTGDLIPLCHPLGLDDCLIKTKLLGTALYIRVRASIHGRTGVEMEAMTAASIAALTVYDMCKSVSKTCYVKNIKLLYKEGGKSGIFRDEEFNGELENLF